MSEKHQRINGSAGGPGETRMSPGLERAFNFMDELEGRQREEFERGQRALEAAFTFAQEHATRDARSAEDERST